MFNQNRVFRLFQLINYLKTHPAKSIRNIVSYLDTSERTVYRYIELIQDLGFKIERDDTNKLFIPSKENELIPFSPQEAKFIEALLLSAGKENKLTGSILSKINKGIKNPVSAEYINNLHLSQLIEKISMAIIDEKQIVLKGYSSLNSESVSDRFLEPVCFTENYTSLSAFEIKSKQNKYFKIERIKEIEILPSNIQYRKDHKFEKPDIFGFQGSNPVKEVEWKMGMRAQLLLKEEYPMSASSIKESSKQGTYLFKAKVQSFVAPTRFVMGIKDNIEVIGSPEFKKYLQEKIKKSRKK
jgi:predicted DNA-binding transcriptional regulator YafY